MATVESRGLDVDLHIEDGRTVALLGANGAGKSTLLSVIAGLLTPDTGRVTLGGRTLTDSNRVQVPTHLRRIGLLAQDPALFPHLSVRSNVAFGPKSRGLKDGAARTQEWLEAVDAVQLADRKPGQLSGGQQQRVALARALAGDPELLLLDEPLAALDVSVAEDLRHLLAQRLEGRTAIIVTHDLLDVLALADRVITLEGGKVVEDGPAHEVLSTPRSDFTARLAGMNLLPGTLIDASEGMARMRTGPWQITGTDQLVGQATQGESVIALITPASLAVHRRTDDTAPGGSPRNALAAQVIDLRATPSGVRVRATAGPDGPTMSADITTAAAADLELTAGSPVWLTVKAHEVTVHADRR
ncbi:sulfate/molybdate ABC transporter ATP-binding protein [Enemella sp. A6]|uniref:sulfate/molybdate ABC transporter ATP-binding protein n=1 Tax=Enemella sp. A6 TaxID=3440152 RepID=UPI003EB8150F